MDSFECPECEILTIVEVTEEEYYDHTSTYSGICPTHEDVSVSVYWLDPDLNL